MRCPPGLGIGLREEPKALAKDPRAAHYIIDFVHPGAHFTRKVLICNGFSTPIHVDLYTAGATIHDGTFDIDQGTGTNAISEWASVQPKALELAAGESRIVEAAVNVPADAPKGEFYGAVVAARPPDPARGIAVAARAAVRIYLAVGSGGLPPTNFRIDSLTAARRADGSPYVLAQVTNTGRRAIDLSGSLKLTKGPGGLSAGPFPAQLGTTLAPGQSEPVTIPLDKALPAGPWLATLDMKSGLLERKAQATILFPTGSGAKAKPVAAKSIPLTKNRDVIVPIAIALLLFVLILLLLIWWRRRKRDDDEEEQRAVQKSMRASR
ncbi:MAG TPA: hypothetical protein VFH66_09855 [Mycobacteriales bacterium]|nr:hypothetical protein [Mycobacteriales bacterium]